MRLWSIHPSQLDRAALIAVWREGLLAKKVLEGKTRGYKNHPQLMRFKQTEQPQQAINSYLHVVADEAEARGYNFDRSKLLARPLVSKMPLNTEQLNYEWQHLLHKCQARSPEHYSKLMLVQPDLHPIFKLRTGPVEAWEITKILTK